MIRYTVPCSLYATDNDHFQLAEIRLSATVAPQFITGLRALLGGKIDALELHDVKHRALIRGEGKVTYPLLIGDRTAYFCEENLFEMENFLLDRLFGRKKANQCLSITINGEANLQMSVGVWVNE